VLIVGYMGDMGTKEIDPLKWFELDKHLYLGVEEVNKQGYLCDLFIG